MRRSALNDQGIVVSRSSSALFVDRRLTTNKRVVYGIGDIHGCYDLMVALLRHIVEDAATAPVSSPLLVFCGDYISRGPRSREVLAALVWVQRKSPIETVILRGNHEAMLLGFLSQPETSASWLKRDGASLLKSYGIELHSTDVDISGTDCVRLRDELMDKMPASHLELVRTSQLYVTCGDYLFVHAGLRPKVPMELQTERDMLWIRADFLDSDHRFEKIIVHGHTWTSSVPEVAHNRIGIDTGAYETGTLTAARLDGSTVEFIQARSAHSHPADEQAEADNSDAPRAADHQAWPTRRS